MECFRCGECCKEQFPMLMTLEEIQLIEETMGVSLERTEVRKGRYKLKEAPVCPFLKDNRCSIYSIRPCQCRLYHCGRLAPTDSKVRTLQGIRDLMDGNPEYARFKEETDAEAVQWGNAHGWSWRGG